MLEPLPEADAIVSTSFFKNRTLRVPDPGPVERVIGLPERWSTPTSVPTPAAAATGSADARQPARALALRRPLRLRHAFAASSRARRAEASRGPMMEMLRKRSMNRTARGDALDRHAPVIRGVRFYLAHAPGLVAHGSKPSRDIARDRRARRHAARRAPPVRRRARLCADPGLPRRAPSRTRSARVPRPWCGSPPCRARRGPARRDRSRGGAARPDQGRATSSTWCARAGFRGRGARRARAHPLATTADLARLDTGARAPPTSTRGWPGPRRRCRCAALGPARGRMSPATRSTRRSPPTCCSRISRPRRPRRWRCAGCWPPRASIPLASTT